MYSTSKVINDGHGKRIGQIVVQNEHQTMVLGRTGQLKGWVRDGKTYDSHGSPVSNQSMPGLLLDGD